MIPTSRSELIEYCLERCGHPVITINIAPKQLENCIDDALQYWREYAIDGQERTFYLHQVTSTDITNRYITLPENILSVVELYGYTGGGVGQLFNAEYYITADAILGAAGTGSGASSYFVAKQYLVDLNWLLNPSPPFRYRIHNRRLHVDTNWSTKFVEGGYIAVECYAYIDPDVYASVWGNWQLRELAQAYVKRQWGDNLRKFNNVSLPSGVTLNGEGIYQSALQEIEMIKSQYIENYGEPLGFFTA